MRTNTELALLNNKNWLLPSPDREFQKSVAETSPFRPQRKKKKPTKPVNSSFVSIFPLFKLPTDQLIFAVLVGFCFQKQASFRLFLMIIFSFQSFRYHSGITNGYQCTYWYYDSDERNVQGKIRITHLVFLNQMLKLSEQLSLHTVLSSFIPLIFQFCRRHLQN